MKVQRTEIFCVEKMGMLWCAAPYTKFRWITYKYWAALPQTSFISQTYFWFVNVNPPVYT
jgi:hypothetical protein